MDRRQARLRAPRAVLAPYMEARIFRAAVPVTRNSRMTRFPQAGESITGAQWRLGDPRAHAKGATGNVDGFGRPDRRARPIACSFKTSAAPSPTQPRSTHARHPAGRVSARKLKGHRPCAHLRVGPLLCARLRRGDRIVSLLGSAKSAAIYSRLANKRLNNSSSDHRRAASAQTPGGAWRGRHRPSQRLPR